MSERPSASHILTNRLSLPAAMIIEPSAVAKASKGVMVGWRAPSGPGISLLDRVAHDRVLEQRELAVEHRDVDLGAISPVLRRWTIAALTATAVYRPAPMSPIDMPTRRRRLALVAGDAHDAALALHDHVVGGILGVRAGMAEARGRGVDQLADTWRAASPSRSPASPSCRGGSSRRPRRPSRAASRRSCGRSSFLRSSAMLFLAAVDRGEVGRLAVDEGAVGAGIVAALGRLDLDHPGAHLGHQKGAVGAGQDAGEIDRRDARQRALGILGHASVLSQWTAVNPATH